MGRPIKKGIDYFAVDCDFNTPFKILIAKYGNEDYELIMSSDLNISVKFFKEFIIFCLNKNIFNSEKFNEHKILTSERIQENYCEAIQRRKGVNVNIMYALIPDIENFCKQNVNKSTQTKLNKTKLNDNNLD